MDGDGPGFNRERLKALITAKGLHWTGLIDLGFHEERVKSWLYAKRSPRTVEDALKISDWLETPLEYLFGFPTRFDGMDVARVASRASLERFLASRRDLAHHVGEILERLCDVPNGPRTVNAWRTLYEGVVVPAMGLGHAEAGIIEQMAGTARSQHSSAVRPNVRQGRAATTRAERPSTPKVFISYSRDDDAHLTWVRSLARDLRAGGLEVAVDQSDVELGLHAPASMERPAHDADYVLFICTPGFAARAATGRDGVGHEKSIVTAELNAIGNDPAKFVPVLRRGEPDEALPPSLRGRAYLDVRNDNQYAGGLARLLDHMRDTHRATAIGEPDSDSAESERMTVPAGLGASSDVLYCRRCGAAPGRKSRCLGATSHDFVSGRGRLYCGRCGQGVGVPTSCTSHRTHDFRSY